MNFPEASIENSPAENSPAENSPAENSPANPASPASSSGLMDIEAVQRALNRSRASVYRYANTDPAILNPIYNPKLLNAELRTNLNDPLMFHPNEVARFAKDILRIRQVTIEVQNAPPDKTQQILLSILEELRGIRECLDKSSEF